MNFRSSLSLSQDSIQGNAKLSEIQEECVYLNEKVIPALRNAGVIPNLKNIISCAELSSLVEEHRKIKNRDLITYTGKVATVNRDAFFRWYGNTVEGSNQRNSQHWGRFLQYR